MRHLSQARFCQRPDSDKREVFTGTTAHVLDACGAECSHQQTDAQTAWKHAIEKLQMFRQGANLGRNPRRQQRASGVPAGRSRWPEPDLIRRRSKRNSPEHAHEHPITGFTPRAAFGMSSFNDSVSPR